MAKRRQPAGLRKYWATHRRKGRKRAAPRRRTRRARKNWLSTGIIVPPNPRRKRRSHRRRTNRSYAMNPRKRHTTRRHHRRSSYRRNPALLGFQIPGVKTIVFAGAGFMAPSLMTSALNQIMPSLLQQTSSMGIAGKYLVKIGSVLGLAWLTKRFVGSNESHAVMIGGSVNVGMSLIQDFAPGFLPANPLGAYVAIRPGSAGTSAPAGMRGYIATRPGLRALPRGRNIMSMPNASAQGDQGQYGTPARYFRY